MKLSQFIAFVFLCSLSAVKPLAAPDDFREAKIAMKTHVYFDQTNKGTLYCGCNYRWLGESGGRIDLASCGYKTRADENRANRLEWEHIFPASNFGRALKCWQKGGRENCKQNDRVFNAIEADMHNLAPSIGEVNSDRSNYNFGMVQNSQAAYGSCKMKVSFKERTAEPPNSVKGMIARTYFYMSDSYNIPLSKQQQQLFIAWNKQYPVTQWEKLREQRISEIMGASNSFVTGERTWELGHQLSGEGLKRIGVTVKQNGSTHERTKNNTADNQSVRGNKRSKIFHHSDCPNYDSVSDQNRINFANQGEALQAGYVIAKNCPQTSS
ncbi:endonuclease [Cellvibrio sp. QJXJ]|uniref:endonuclease n=1 Tax=Cellvibrio sp. QJXJ TaxID=2964606 RepID=UPI0021C263B5|nr:endonuclease [Cellvibrio sp. QJXJ]UUA75204.1 endonuclease [Cellvibrio sp. QJXJ]